jgi:hypothetical protein
MQIQFVGSEGHLPAAKAVTRPATKHVIAGVTDWAHAVQRSLHATQPRGPTPRYSSFSVISKHGLTSVCLINIKASYIQKQRYNISVSQINKNSVTNRVVFVTNKTGIGFYDRIYWTFIQLVTTVHISLSDALSSSSDWTLH